MILLPQMSHTSPMADGRLFATAFSIDPSQGGFGTNVASFGVDS